MAHATNERGAISPLAGQSAPRSILVDLGRLERAYYKRTPELDDPNQLVIFGTSGHRGSPFSGSFTDTHIAAITQAIGGLKVITASGWFAARPSGTEDIYKMYAENFSGAAHLNALVSEATELVNCAIGGRP